MPMDSGRYFDRSERRDNDRFRRTLDFIRFAAQQAQPEQWPAQQPDNRQNSPEQAHAVDNPAPNLDRQRHEMMRNRI